MQNRKEVPSCGLTLDGQSLMGNNRSRGERAGRSISMQHSPRVPLSYHTLSDEHLSELYLENGALRLCNAVTLDKGKTLANTFKAKQP